MHPARRSLDSPFLKRNPRLRLLLPVGGGTILNYHLSPRVSAETTRNNLLQQSRVSEESHLNHPYPRRRSFTPAMPNIIMARETRLAHREHSPMFAHVVSHLITQPEAFAPGAADQRCSKEFPSR